MEWLANCNPAVVLMESCKGSTVRARKIADLGHDSRLVKGADVEALRNVCQKDDIRDADYIARLFYVPGTKYVFVKNQRQQSLQFLQNEYKSLQELRILVGESDPHLSRRVRLFSTQVPIIRSKTHDCSSGEKYGTNP